MASTQTLHRGLVIHFALYTLRAPWLGWKCEWPRQDGTVRQAQHCTTRPRNPRGMIQSNLKDLGATWMPKMVCPYWREIRCKGDENDQDGIGKLSKLCQDGTVCGHHITFAPRQSMDDMDDIEWATFVSPRSNWSQA